MSKSATSIKVIAACLILLDAIGFFFLLKGYHRRGCICSGCNEIQSYNHLWSQDDGTCETCGEKCSHSETVYIRNLNNTFGCTICRACGKVLHDWKIS